MKINRQPTRSANGLYLVESLIAMTLGTMLVFALLDMYSTTLRLTSTNSYRQSADWIAQSVLDSVKRSNPTGLPIGSYPLLVNSQSVGDRGPAIHPLPVGLNNGDLMWTLQSLAKEFKGTVILEIQPGLTLGSKIAVVTVVYNDSSSVGAKSTGTLGSLHAKGVNYWP